jgi:hypothetical protein
VLPRRPLALAAFALIAVALTGCAPPSEQARPSPTPTPIFATDADALAAATKAYARYLTVTEEVLKDGGENPGRLRAVATGEQLEAELDASRTARKDHLSGEGTIASSGVTSVTYLAKGNIIGRVCENNADMVVLDKAGISLVSPERRPSTLYDVRFQVSPGKPTRLLVSDRVPVSEQPCW